VKLVSDLLVSSEVDTFIPDNYNLSPFLEPSTCVQTPKPFSTKTGLPDRWITGYWLVTSCLSYLTFCDFYIKLIRSIGSLNYSTDYQQINAIIMRYSFILLLSFPVDLRIWSPNLFTTAMTSITFIVY
jgi:hypothetical protein